ncbi:MAG: RagB/SusD family nutrient uptake outer membrane protein [Chitinophagaceae bacterium]
MKKQQYKILMFCCLGIAFITYACSKKFLDKKPLGQLSEVNVANKAGIQAILIGAYSFLDGSSGLSLAGNSVQGFTYGAAGSNWVYGSIVADDSYKGSTPSDQPPMVLLATWSKSTSTSTYMTIKWQILYGGVQRANDVLRLLPKATDIPAADAKVMEAESRFLRGHYHFDAKKMWNNPIYVDETITYDANNYNVPNIDASGNFINIWPKIEADFQFAIDNLPATQPQKGRANKWAAMAYLAKAYMFQDKYAEAKPLLENLIANGVTAAGAKYTLVNFQDNFNAQTKNGPESVFAFQTSVNDGSELNGNFGDVLNFPNGPGAPGGCCGFNNPSFNLANAYKTDAVTGLPLLDTWNNGTGVSDSTNIYTGTLDPRVDLTIGRPGMPYLDWGPQNIAWIRDPQVNGVFSPRKNVYAKSQFGSYSSNETSFWGATQINANNYTFIRFADIILWAAECEVEIGSLDKAQEYVNMVRGRAADPTGWVYKNATYSASSSKYSPQVTPADNYKIGLYPAGNFAGGGKDYARKAVQFERRLELAMEGHRFFDLSRWDNGTGFMANVLNTYQSVEKTKKSFFAVNPTAQFTKGTNEFFPIPQSQIDLENATGTIVLKQNPGYN